MEEKIVTWNDLLEEAKKQSIEVTSLTLQEALFDSKATHNYKFWVALYFNDKKNEKEDVFIQGANTKEVAFALVLTEIKQYQH